MKKLITLSLVLFVLSHMAYSQEDDLKIKKNEIKVNALYTVLSGFEGTYERLINEESGIGVSAYLSYNSDGINNLINYYISPYYRLYFGKKYASGFFIEGFGMLNSEDGPRTIIIENGTVVSFKQEKDVTNFALGIGAGGKWVTKSGFIGELNLGVGRNLINSERTEIDFVGKIAVTIGYRF